MSAEIHPSAIVYPGTVLGEGVKVLENAVVGKQPTLSPRSTAKREPLPPTVIGAGTIVSTGAIVFAGSTIGERVILGDQSCVRERVAIGDDVVVGRGSLVENDTTIGAMTKIQADAYITAYSTLEEHVFIAPCVVTTNDNWMGRTEKRFGNIKGPTIRRGARIGGGAILCPAIEIGEDAFVGAGAVVTKDVPPRVVVVGSPARVLRDVPEDELLDAAVSSSASSRRRAGTGRAPACVEPHVEQVPARRRRPVASAPRRQAGRRGVAQETDAWSIDGCVPGRQSASAGLDGRRRGRRDDEALARRGDRRGRRRPGRSSSRASRRSSRLGAEERVGARAGVVVRLVAIARRRARCEELERSRLIEPPGAREAIVADRAHAAPVAGRASTALCSRSAAT